jgi:hypothetical protein
MDVLFPLSVERGGILVEGVWSGKRYRYIKNPKR